MYIRALLFKRYSRLAALYSILETGRQPSFGGSGFARVAEHASNDPVMTNATRKLFWRNDMSPSSHYRSATPSTLRATPSLPSDRACRTLRKPPVHRSQQFARLLHLALRAPEACEAHGGAEFPGFGLLLAGDREGVLEILFCFSRIW